MNTLNLDEMSDKGLEYVAKNDKRRLYREYARQELIRRAATYQGRITEAFRAQLTCDRLYSSLNINLKW